MGAEGMKGALVAVPTGDPSSLKVTFLAPTAATLQRAPLRSTETFAPETGACQRTAGASPLAAAPAGANAAATPARTAARARGRLIRCFFIALHVSGGGTRTCRPDGGSGPSAEGVTGYPSTLLGKRSD